MRHPEAAGVPFASVQDVPVDQRIAQTMSEVGPSITLSAVAETVAFALGAIVSMPAVNSFAGYSAVAIFVDFLGQVWPKAEGGKSGEGRGERKGKGNGKRQKTTEF